MSATPFTEDPRRWWSLGALAFSLFMIYLDTTVVNVALPSIQVDLHVSLAELEWTVNAYTLSFAVLMLTGGKLADLLGRRRLFLAGLVVFTLSSLVCGLAASGGILIAARAVQGAGAALMLPSTLSIISATFRLSERGTAYGIWATASGIGVALGPLVGGLLVEGIDWRWIFYVNVPVGVLSFVAAKILVPESRDTSAEQALDLPGLALSGVALFALTFALVEGNRQGWGSTEILGCFVVSALAFALFLVVEMRVRLPMLDLLLFRSGALVGASVVSLLAFFALFGVFFFVSIYLQDVLGYGAVKTGATFLPFSVPLVVSTPLAGRLTDRIGARWPMVGGMALLGLGLVSTSRLELDSSFGDLLPGLLLGGFGIGLTIAPATATVLGSVPDAKAGVASGVVNTFRQAGGVLGVAVMGAIFASHIGGLHIGDPRLGPAFMSGFHAALLVAAAASFAGAVLAALTISNRVNVEPELALEM